MDMIKKIAITASTMLFVLAQIFSFYVIYTSQQEKAELLRQGEWKNLEKRINEFEQEFNRLTYGNTYQDHVLIYCFRKNMTENSALYKGEQELCNTSPYTFEAEKIEITEYNSNNLNYKIEKLNGKRLILFYRQLKINKQVYMMFHVMDITFIYENSRKLVIREVLISTLSAGAMALLLIFLIKKITRPLQAVNEAQLQLIGSMSHELKTPLTAIKGYSETLLHVNLSKEQEQKALNYIHTESGRLSRLSEKMMELTRLYEPECKITLQKVSVEELFENVEHSVKYRLKEKEITLLREGSYQGKSKNLDLDLMTSFLINLINNSITASDSGSCIFIGADENSLWVRDEGCGIPSQEVDKVRKAFYRVDKSRSRKSGNMGLGLALCDQIAKVHQGTMKIESEPGKGTRIVYQSFIGK